MSLKMKIENIKAVFPLFIDGASIKQSMHKKANKAHWMKKSNRFK